MSVIGKYQGYNLRSTKVMDGRHCYLQQRLSNQNSFAFHPKVCLERLKVLENSDGNSFYMEKDRIKPIKSITRKTSKKWNLKCMMVTFLILILVLAVWRVDVNSFGTLFKKLRKPFQNFTFEAIYFYKKHFKFHLNNEKEEKVRETLDSDLCEINTNTEKQIEILEIKKMAKNLILKLKKIEKLKKSSTNFIEEQCQKNFSLDAINDSKLNILEEDNSDSSISEFFEFTDYALESNGAKILSVFDTEPYGILTLKFWNYDFGEIHSNFLKKYINLKDASAILVPWKKPGDCWAFSGSRGRVQIQLSKKIVVTALTYDHLTKDLLRNGKINSAPKKIVIIGIEELENQYEQKIHLGTFEYEISGPSTQMFFVKPKMDSPFLRLELIIESNHGNSEYTCMYKIRVHGIQVNI